MVIFAWTVAAARGTQSEDAAMALFLNRVLRRKGHTGARYLSTAVDPPTTSQLNAKD